LIREVSLKNENVVKISIRIIAIIFFLVTCCSTGFSLESDEILVIANNDISASVRIARYYCTKRGVPAENLIAWQLGSSLKKTISREDYNKKLVEPLRSRLTSEKYAGKIKCLLTTYGVPIVVGGRGQLEGKEGELNRLRELISKQEKEIEIIDGEQAAAKKKLADTKIAQLKLRIDQILGKETSASVDSELSMVLLRNYELYRWQPNRLRSNLSVLDAEDELLTLGLGTLMVSRLDGPSEEIVKGLIDKALSAEKSGLEGVAYFDSRSIIDESQYGQYDQSLRDLAILTRYRRQLPVEEERTAKLFSAGSCPETAIYCGWYSLREYVDAFDFVDGAVGFHISSLEAVGLRDSNAETWCPAMLTDGITATLGAIAEPYLHSFPKPRSFFTELYEGRCLVEAYYRTKPFNSWQLLLIGDPLYRPFMRHENSQ
jgi:uncharacterized protein (TIGR03790 family)